MVSSRGVVHVEIPEVYELVNVAILLSEYDQNQHQKIFVNDPYAIEVKQYFEKFITHPCITEFSKKIKSINDNYAVRDMSYDYQFDSSGKIVRQGLFNNIVPYQKGLLPSLIGLLQTFALDSNFRLFYTKHQPFYNQIKKRVLALSQPKNQWDWLESRYPQRISSYRIICSPITGGNHRTAEGQLNSFKEILMFINAPTIDRLPTLQEKQSAMRILFTEIDHNYVNPTSEKLKDLINQNYKNLSVWSKGRGSEAYSSPILMFNEYMTWGLFDLYLTTQYDPKNCEQGIQTTMRIMNERGFIKYSDFQAELLAYFRRNPRSSGTELQKHMATWSAEIQKANH